MKPVCFSIASLNSRSTVGSRRSLLIGILAVFVCCSAYLTIGFGIANATIYLHATHASGGDSCEIDGPVPPLAGANSPGWLYREEATRTYFHASDALPVLCYNSGAREVETYIENSAHQRFGYDRERCEDCNSWQSYHRAAAGGLTQGVYFEVFIVKARASGAWVLDSRYPECTRTGTGDTLLVCEIRRQFTIPPWPDAGTGGGTPGGSTPEPCVCDPVNPRTGEYYENDTDLPFGGTHTELTPVRTYSSIATSNPRNLLGAGWTLSYAAGLTINREGEAYSSIVVDNPNGSDTRFESPSGSANGPWFGPAGVAATLSRSGDGKWKYVIDGRQTMTFDPDGRIVSSLDRNGNGITFAYQSNRLTRVTDAAQRFIDLAYNESGLLASIVDNSGRTVRYGYDERSLLSSVLDANGGVTRYTYDSAKRLLSVVDPRGNTKLTNEYDAEGRVSAQTDAIGGRATFSYEVSPTVVGTSKTTVTFPEGNKNSFEFEGGVPIAITREGGRSETYDYTGSNIIGLPSAVTSNGRTERYTYDASGNVLTQATVLPDGSQTSLETFTYDVNNNLLTSVGPTGLVTQWAYDAAGNVYKEIEMGAGGRRMDYIRNAKGDVVQRIDSLNMKWKYEVDPAGNVTSSTAPSGRKTTTVYSAAGFEVSSVAPKGNVSGGTPASYRTTTSRDPLGRPTQVTDPLGRVSKMTYDPNGNLTSVVRPGGQATTYEYDARDLRVRTIAPSGAMVSKTYDPSGDVIASQDANGRVTTYVRDAGGRPTLVVDAFDRVKAFSYDSFGNLTKETDTHGGVTQYLYDALGRLEYQGFSSNLPKSIKYAYDELGRRKSMRDGTGETKFEWNRAGLLTKRTAPSGKQVSYEYDAIGRTTKIVYPSGKFVKREYFDEFLASMTDWRGGRTDFTWDRNGNLESTRFPGRVNTDLYEYNAADEMTGVKMNPGTPIPYASVQYGRDEEGRVSSINSTGLPGAVLTDVAYDQDGRLTKYGSRLFAYDPAGNPTTIAGTTANYDGVDQLMSVGATNYSFDAFGRRVGVAESSSQSTMTYDQNGRLIGFQRPPAPGVERLDLRYRYDGDGLRSERETPGEPKAMTWDTSGDIPKLIDDGTNSYMYGPDGRPIAQMSGDDIKYLHHDEQGSTRAMTSSTGAVVGTATYDPYGVSLGTTGTTTPVGYRGEYTDEAGLVDLRARIYDPKTAQFLSRDPLVEHTGEPYLYSGGNPMLYSDPLGLMKIPGLPNIDLVQQVKDAFPAVVDNLKENYRTWAQVIAGVTVVVVCLAASEVCLAAMWIGAGVQSTFVISGPGTTTEKAGLVAANLALATGGSALAGGTQMAVNAGAPRWLSSTHEAVGAGLDGLLIGGQAAGAPCAK